MRHASIGMFWQDTGPRPQAPRPRPPIPDTGWRSPTHYPNLACARTLSVDVETYDPELDDFGPGWARGRGHICGFSVGADNDGRWYFPIRHEVEPETNLDPGHSIAWLKHTLSDLNQPKIGANLIYDVGWLQHEGIHIKGDLIDVQYAEALLEERAKVNLEVLSQKYLNEGKTSGLLKQWILDAYAPPADKWRKDIYRAPPRLAGPYGEGDADLPIRLAPLLYQRLGEEGLLDLFKIECELIPLIVAMRFAGVSVDTRKAEELSASIIAQTKAEQDKLDQEAGEAVEVSKSTSLARVFDKLGLKYNRTPTGQPSFTKPFLNSVKHPVGGLIKEIRALTKLRSDFIDGSILRSNVNGKVYCSFHPLRGDEDGTRSGRFSSSVPNLQQVPVRHRLGKDIRALFVPDPGHVRWRKFDYSQIEYRFLVHFAVGPGSDEARALYVANPDTDYHEFTRQLIHRITGKLLDRRPVKNINFGFTFGMGEKKLCADLNLSKTEGKELFGAYHTGVPFVKPTMNHAMQQAEITGVIRTILGRCSRFELFGPARYSEEEAPPLPYHAAVIRYGDVRRSGLHKALNRLLQGSAADLLKLAMWRCWREGVFAETGVPRLTVHDELDHSDPGGKDAAFAEEKRILEQCLPLRVPVKVDESQGANWGEAA